MTKNHRSLDSEPDRIRVDIVFEGDDLSKPRFPSLIRYFDALGKRKIDETLELRPAFIVQECFTRQIFHFVIESQNINFKKSAEKEAPQILWWHRTQDGTGIAPKPDPPNGYVEVGIGKLVNDQEFELTWYWKKPYDREKGPPAKPQISWPFSILTEKSISEEKSKEDGVISLAIANDKVFK